MKPVGMQVHRVVTPQLQQLAGLHGFEPVILNAIEASSWPHGLAAIVQKVPVAQGEAGAGALTCVV